MTANLTDAMDERVKYMIFFGRRYEHAGGKRWLDFGNIDGVCAQSE